MNDPGGVALLEEEKLWKEFVADQYLKKLNTIVKVDLTHYAF